MYVDEILELLATQVEKEEAETFAFRFASVIVRCPFFSHTCLQRSIPIFLHSVGKSNEAKSLLVDAFIPYLSRLETDPDAQQLMVQVIECTDSPSLSLVAAAVLKRPIPFVKFERSYQEIVSVPITSGDAAMAVRLFGVMAPSASLKLLESIVEITTDLLAKFELAMDWAVFGPIYRAVRDSFGQLRSAGTFFELIIRLDPGRKFEADAVKVDDESLGPAVTEIAGLVEKGGHTTSATTCKQLNQLRGLIDQKNPPNIYPFATQHEMYLSLASHVARKSVRRVSSSRIRSSLSTAIATNRSILWSLLLIPDFGLMALAPIENKKIQLQALDLEGGEAREFVLSPQKFVALMAE
jgi:hypothetical protein